MPSIPPKADIRRRDNDVRKWLKADIRSHDGDVWAIGGTKILQISSSAWSARDPNQLAPPLSLASAVKSLRNYAAFEMRHMAERCGTDALIGSMCLLATVRLTFAPLGEKAL